MKKVYLIGSGPGSELCLTQEARECIKSCPNVAATARIAELLVGIKPISVMAYGELEAFARKSQGDVALLVSGDSVFYSAATALYEKLKGEFDVCITNGISSLQYLAARLAIPLTDVVSVSTHGRKACVQAYVSYNKHVFVLTGGEYKAQDVCRALADSGLGDVQVVAAQNLSMPDEVVMTGSAQELSGAEFEDLACLMVTNNRFIPHYKPLTDEEFMRGGAPMSKYEVRQFAINHLGVAPGDLVYDIGAGTGSCSVALARKAYRGQVIAMEIKQKAFDLIVQNKDLLGAHNVTPMLGDAMELMPDLPPPDCVFIGGSSGKLPEMIRTIKEKNSNVRIVVTAITLQTLNEAIDTLERLGFDNVQVSQIFATRINQVGRYRMMNAQNPIFVVSAV